MVSSPIISWQIVREKVEAVTYFVFLGSKITADGHYSHEIKRHLLFGRKAMTNLDSIFKSRHHFANKCSYSQKYGFSSSHVWMWELDQKEGWVLKNWYFQTVVLLKTWESFGQQGDQTSQSSNKSTLNIHWKIWCWSSNNLASWYKEPTCCKRP